MNISFQFGDKWLHIDIERGALRIRVCENGDEVAELTTKHDDEIQRLIESIGIVLRSKSE